MGKYILSYSSFFILLMNFKIEHILSPWKIEIDLDQEIITVTKRNQYYIGIDTETVSFRFIRRIKINEHLFGGDISIRTIGATITACYLPKKSLVEIRQALLEYNRHKKMGFVFG